MHSTRSLDRLGDFTTTARVVPLTAVAVVIGIDAAYVAAALLALIGFFTNVFFFQRFSSALVTPAGHHLGVFVIPGRGLRLPPRRSGMF